MKPVLLAAFLVCAPIAHAPIAHAQEPAPVAPDATKTAPDVMAAKKPTEAGVKEAVDLLTGTAKRYIALKTFEVVINREADGRGITGLKEEDFVRLRWSSRNRDYKFVISQKLSANSWTKTIFDGQSVVDFSSNWGKIYERRAPRPSAKASKGQKVWAELLYGNAAGPLVWMLTGDDELFDRFTEAQLPLLYRLDVTDEGALKKINIGQNVQSQAGTPIVNTLEIWINPQTGMVEKSRQFDTFKGAIVETYTQQRFNPDFEPNLFRAAAPKGYKLRD